MKLAFAVAFVLLATACTDTQVERHAVEGTHDRSNTAGEQIEQTLPPIGVTRSFDAGGISTVVLRAANASTIVIENTEGQITVSGVPEGGARGYRSPDPDWRETPASEWGLDFVAARHNDVLVISTKNEMGFIHHRYVFASLRINVPAAVKVVPVVRELTGSGEADVSPPG